MIAGQIRPSRCFELAERRGHAFGHLQHPRELVGPEREAAGRRSSLRFEPVRQLAHRGGGFGVGRAELLLKRCVVDVGKDARDVGLIEIREAAEGRDAALEERTFDCMVLDLGLPDIPGLQLIHQIEHDLHLRDLPIIVYTGKELSKQEETELRMVAEAIVVKGVKSPERLLDETALYVRPINNPDGGDLYRHTAQSNRSSVRPHDSDGDGLLDEDPPEDLDGDGLIRQMRQKVEKGKGQFMLDPKDPSGRLLTRAPAGEGDYNVWSEGIDNDLDGRYNEDGIGAFATGWPK